MYVSSAQIETSLTKLSWVSPFMGISFLGFKRAGIPVGKTTRISFSALVGEVLDMHYKPSQSYEGYYTPFLTSDPSNRWTKPRYGSTSLQRITADTFGDVFLHPKRSSEWGWHPDYLQRLSRHLEGKKVPAWDLAVWLYRDHAWPEGATGHDLIAFFLQDNRIHPNEASLLLDLNVDSVPNWLTEQPFSEAELLNVIGLPPGMVPEGGAALRLLELQEVGPASRFMYEPADRLNIITGDNSLGKTFLLDTAWWALTDTWLEHPLQPRRLSAKSKPFIRYAISSKSGTSPNALVRFNWDKLDWEHSSRRQVLPGLVIYARHDGSFALWDPTRLDMLQASGVVPQSTYIGLDRDAVWNGIEVDSTQHRSMVLSNGLLRDWMTWQLGGSRYRDRFDKLTACLRLLSPSATAPLVPGEPMRLPYDAREIPTLLMPYGEVPIIHASAGVKRVVALAYLLVWAWSEHLAAAEMLRRAPQRRLVLMVDEVEAHLHPRWQRVIVPALMAVIEELASDLNPQIHVATHSPMVLASAEAIFDFRLDDLHHLRQDGDAVILEELEFVKRGRADAWLTSEAFGLAQARSVPAEDAVEAARRIQLAGDPSNDDVRSINKQLERSLSADDPFWARWRYFALQHGVNG